MGTQDEKFMGQGCWSTRFVDIMCTFAIFIQLKCWSSVRQFCT